MFERTIWWEDDVAVVIDQTRLPHEATTVRWLRTLVVVASLSLVGGCVDDVKRMDPDIALRMPLRLLRYADHRLELWKKLVDNSQLIEPFQPDRWVSGQ